jgi:hypothetical protein
VESKGKGAAGLTSAGWFLVALYCCVVTAGSFLSAGGADNTGPSPFYQLV